MCQRIEFVLPLSLTFRDDAHSEVSCISTVRIARAVNYPTTASICLGSARLVAHPNPCPVPTY
jgi:hypothetical protein